MKTETTHFNDLVAQPLRDKLAQLATLAKDDFISDCGRGESYGCADINAIYGYHISGFIPSQLGGYEVTELYRDDLDTSYHFNAAQTASSEQSEKHMLACFWNDNIDQATRAKLEAAGLNAETYGYCDLEEISSGLADIFGDYENEWFEPALLRLEMWIDDDKEAARLGNEGREPQSVFIRLSLNYRDAPYYRSQSDDTLIEFNLPIARFMRVKNETILTILRKKI